MRNLIYGIITVASGTSTSHVEPSSRNDDPLLLSGMMIIFLCGVSCTSHPGSKSVTRSSSAGTWTSYFSSASEDSAVGLSVAKAFFFSAQCSWIPTLIGHVAYMYHCIWMAVYFSLSHSTFAYDKDIIYHVGSALFNWSSRVGGTGWTATSLRARVLVDKLSSDWRRVASWVCGWSNLGFFEVPYPELLIL